MCTYTIPKTFIINLESQHFHKDEMKKQMEFISNADYYFYTATNGKDNKKVLNQYNTYLNVNSSVTQKKYILPSYYIPSKQHLTLSSLGLINSNLNLFKYINKHYPNIDHILILEDDVYSYNKFDDEYFINETNLKNKDLIYLGCQNSKIKDLYKECNRLKEDKLFINIDHTYKNLIYGAYSLIISKKLRQHILQLGIEFFIHYNLSWDLAYNYIRETNKDYSFYIYFKQLFIPNVMKDGINGIRDMTFYKDRNINLMNYYT